MLLPWIALALAYAALYARMVRANLMETLSEDYIRTARAKGMSERKVIYRHGLRGALTPVVTIFGMDLATMFGGLLLTETVFNMPGIGKYAIQGILGNDFPAVMGVVVFGTFFIVVANLVVDLMYAVLDPRVRHI
jgi:peptide/nickel transport system permease protein